MPILWLCVVQLRFCYQFEQHLPTKWLNQSNKLISNHNDAYENHFMAKSIGNEKWIRHFSKNKSLQSHFFNCITHFLKKKEGSTRWIHNEVGWLKMCFDWKINKASHAFTLIIFLSPFSESICAQIRIIDIFISEIQFLMD